MKKLILYVVYGLSTSFLLCQNSGQSLPIGLYIHTSDNLSRNSDSFNLLESKLQSLISTQGYSSLNNGHNPIVLAAKVNIVETRKVETGLRNQLVNIFEFSLVLANVETRTVYSSLNFNQNGMGPTNDIALRRAISAINNNLVIQDFLSVGETKIHKYYDEFCTDILSNSKNLALRLEYEESFNVLLSIPMGSSCYSKAQAELSNQYTDYINFKCANELITAKSLLAQNNYQSGLKILSQIYGSKDCQKEILETLKNTEAEIDEQTKIQWSYLFESQKNSFDLQQSRIDASRDVMVAYYSNRPPVYNYNVWTW